MVFGSVKTEQSRRTLALNPFLQSMMVRQVECFRKLFGEPVPKDFIFFDTDGCMIDPDKLTHYFSAVLIHLGLPHVKLHALRHTFATRAVELGIDIGTVSGLLGHADVTITSHYYLHPRQQAMNNALWKLGSAAITTPAAERRISRVTPIPRGSLIRTRQKAANEADG